MDDGISALAGLSPGVRWEDGKLVVKPDKVEEDRNVKSDHRTFEELAKIAETLYKCLDFTSDSPSSHVEEKALS